MKTLFVLRGAPGCGKSTWIKQNHFEDKTISSDEVRLVVSGKRFDEKLNHFVIPQDYFTQKVTWEVIFHILKRKMQNNQEFIFLDATCSHLKDLRGYVDFVKDFDYKVVVIDFSDIPLNICQQQNSEREDYRRVPEYAIKNCYDRIKSQVVPENVQVVSFKDFNLKDFEKTEI